MLFICYNLNNTELEDKLSLSSYNYELKNPGDHKRIILD